jgi:MFS family permease
MRGAHLDGPTTEAQGNLRLRDLAGFRKLLTVRLSSQLGDGLFAAGLTWLVLLSPERRQSPSDLAIAAAVLFLPFSVVGPFTGVFLDRWSRRQVLAWGQPVRIALVAGVIAAGDRVHFVVAYTLAIGCLGVNRFLLAALSAGLPHVVPRPLLLRANALAPTAGTISGITGVALGTGLLALFGDDGGGIGSALALLAAAVAFASASLLARRIDRDGLGPDRTAEPTALSHELSVVVRGLGHGLRHLWQRRPAGRALTVLASYRFWIGLWTVQVAMLALHGDGERDLPTAALVAGASGAGLVTAAVATPPGRRRLGDRGYITLLLAATGVVIAVLTPIAGAVALTIAGYVAGVGAQGIKICVDTAVQRHVADDYLGRAFAIYDVAFNVAFVAAAGLATAIVPKSGQSWLAIVLAALGLALTGLWYRYFCDDGADRKTSIDR